MFSRLNFAAFRWGGYRVALAFVLGCLLALSVGWQQRAAQAEEAPPGCEAVYSATTRGGTVLKGGGGCIFKASKEGEVAVVKIIDGDTIEVAGRQKVRYIGVDTPELKPKAESYAREATEYNKRLLRKNLVRLEKDVSERDRFGRLLRYIYADDILVNAELVREGYATAVAYSPDTRYARCFAALEAEAREARRGMWAGN